VEKTLEKEVVNFQKDLNLTQAQKDQLSKMRTDVRSQMGSIRNDQSLTQDQKKEKIHSLMKDQQDKFKSVLTKEQVEKLESARKERKDRVTK
jgi:periplasmic protein CpxP/Spy